MLMPNQLVLCDMQKYRLYLKRLSAVASQEASIVAAFGGTPHFFTWEPLKAFRVINLLPPVLLYHPSAHTAC